MSFVKSFLIDDSELTYYANGDLKNNTVFKDYDDKKYIKDPFNPLIKDDLLYHHNIRVYKDCFLNKSKTNDIEKDVNDRILYKKGILKDKLICIRPCFNDFTIRNEFNKNEVLKNIQYDYIKFNLKVFCLNYDNDLIIERDSLISYLILDEDISIENSFNNTILFEVNELTIFQNTNLCFISLQNTSKGQSDLKVLVLYDLLNKQVLQTITDFDRIIFFDQSNNNNNNKKIGILNSEKKLSIYKIKNKTTHNNTGVYLKKLNTVNDNFQIPLNKGLFQQDKTFLCISDKTEGQIINFELIDLLNIANEEESVNDGDYNSRVQMNLFPAHKSRIYNVAISKSTRFILTSSTNGTVLKIFLKTKNENKRSSCPQYQLYGEFKRGMEKALNYEMGFSNDERIAYCLSFKRTLHFFWISFENDLENNNNNNLNKKNKLSTSIQTLKLTNRLTDDTCKVIVLRSISNQLDICSYNVYIIWRLSGIIELYDLTVDINNKNKTSKSISTYCKKINWLLLY